MIYLPIFSEIYGEDEEGKIVLTSNAGGVCQITLAFGKNRSTTRIRIESQTNVDTNISDD